MDNVSLYPIASLYSPHVSIKRKPSMFSPIAFGQTRFSGSPSRPQFGQQATVSYLPYKAIPGADVAEIAQRTTDNYAKTNHTGLIVVGVQPNVVGNELKKEFKRLRATIPQGTIICIAPQVRENKWVAYTNIPEVKEPNQSLVGGSFDDFAEQLTKAYQLK